jgi:excisionase family DNA binding protein
MDFMGSSQQHWMQTLDHSKEGGSAVDRLFYRVREAAEIVGLSRAKTYQLVMDGRLGSVMVDGARRIPADELQAFVDRMKVAAGLEPMASAV